MKLSLALYTLYLLLVTVFPWRMRIFSRFRKREKIRRGPPENRRRLLLEMDKWIGPWSEWSGLSGGKGGFSGLPRYKFYTDIMMKLMKFSRTYGTPLGPLLQGLKDGLIKDDQFERKVSKDFQGVWGQMLFLAMITWMFIFFTQAPSLAFPRVSWEVLFFVALGQLSGGGLLFYWYEGTRKRVFAPFPSFFFFLYSFPALVEAGVPFSVALKESGVSLVFRCQDSRFRFLQDKIQRALEDLQKKGGSFRLKFQEMTREGQFLMEESYAKVMGRLQTMKFFFLFVFFLGPYFFYLFSLLKSSLNLSLSSFSSTN